MPDVESTGCRMSRGRECRVPDVAFGQVESGSSRVSDAESRDAAGLVRSLATGIK